MGFFSESSLDPFGDTPLRRTIRLASRFRIGPIADQITLLRQI
jgi:hypothetical protein